MVQFRGNTSNVGSWIQAGKAGAEGAGKAFKVARENSPDYGKLAETAIQARRHVERATIQAEATTAKAGLQALSKVKKTAITTKGLLDAQKIKLDAQRKAGVVGMFGAAAGGLFMGMENKKAEARQKARDAKKDESDKKRQEALLGYINRPDPDVTAPGPSRDKPTAPGKPQMEDMPTAPSPSSSDDSPGSSPVTLSSSITESSGDTPFTRQNVYTYLTKTKGLSHNKAYGMMANLDRESSFTINPQGGDNGNSFGSLQWNNTYGRSDRMKKYVPNWQTNWKGQLDYALSDKQLPEYNKATQTFLNTTFDTPLAAADNFMTNWERPADTKGGSLKHTKFLSTYDFK